MALVIILRIGEHYINALSAGFLDRFSAIIVLYLAETLSVLSYFFENSVRKSSHFNFSVRKNNTHMTSTFIWVNF